MDRGQIHTLEAVLAGLLIVGALLFASQATAVTPLSASTSNQHIENQQQTMAEDVLSIAARNGDLQEALLYWNASVAEDGHFAYVDRDHSTYSNIVGTDHPLNESFAKAFGQGEYAYNLDVRFVDADGDFDDIGVIAMGTPSDNAVTATRTVTLFIDDEVYSGEPLDELGADFWATPHPDSAGLVYNAVEVKLTIWRM